MTKIGYARVSTTDQNLTVQRNQLKKAGCKVIRSEKITGTTRNGRKELETILDFIRKGDQLVVTKLDCLARSMRDLIEIVDLVKEKGAELRILAMNLDTSNATGELMLNVLGSVAQFERSMMLERQREGIAKAKAEGKFKGRAPTAQRKSVDVIRMWSDGTKPPEIVEALGISLSSVYRIIRGEQARLAEQTATQDQGTMAA